MSLELGFEQFAEDDMPGEQQETQFVSKPGRCHAKLIGFDEYGDSKNGRHIFKWEVVAHEESGESGKVVWDYCSHPSPTHKDGGKTATNILFGRAIALGLETAESLKSCRAEGRKPNLDFASAVGRTACLSLTSREWEGEKRINVGASFHLNDPRTKEYPKSAAFVARNQPAAPATPQQPASASANPFATNQPSPV